MLKRHGKLLFQKKIEHIYKKSVGTWKSSPMFCPINRTTSTFALLILVLVFKPTGLFGEKVTDKV